MTDASRTVTIPDTHANLIQTSPVVILATNGPDGFPQVTAIWFLVEPDGTIKASLNTARQKVKNLRRDPNCSLFFIDLTNPYRTLEIRATATIRPDDDYAFADRVGAKYGGVNLREQDRPGETRVEVAFEPVKVNTFG